MQYKRFDDKIFARIDPGEEILQQLSFIAEKEQISLAHVTGLGAVNDFTTGVFDVQKKEFYPVNTTGSYEIVSLTGTITEKENKPYLHIHMSAGNKAGNVIGGHLNRAVVSATAELVIDIVNGKIGRRFSEEIGLNLFDFSV